MDLIRVWGVFFILKNMSAAASICDAEAVDQNCRLSHSSTMKRGSVAV